MNITILNSLYTDAYEEYENNPQLFTEAFYDPKKNINSLLRSSRFVVIGRKGTGKTALKQKFLLTVSAMENTYIVDIKVNLKDFDYLVEKIGIDENYLAKAWQLFILLQIFKHLYEKKIISIRSITKDIQDLIYLSSKSIFHEISKMDLEISFKSKHLDINKKIPTNSENDKLNINIMIDKLISKLKSNKNSSKLYVTIDSLDTFLNQDKEKEKLYILSLINASRDLNNILQRTTLSVKIILFIRNEMIDDLVYQDIGKIKRDLTIILKWEIGNKPENSDIINMLYLRFFYSGYNGSISDFINDLNWYFKPTKYDFFTRFIEISLSRPRDILMYIKYCQDICGSKEQLDPDDLKRIDQAFTSEYFMDEVKDELTGHFDDQFVRELPNILYKLPSDRFTYNTWREVILRHDDRFNDDLVNESLKKMYEFGFIGMIKLSHDLNIVQKRIDEVPIFSYEKPLKFSLNNCDYCLHRGIRKGLYEK